MESAHSSASGARAPGSTVSSTGASVGRSVASHFRVVVDFDGTLVVPNVAIDLVAEFVPDGARVAGEIDILLHEGKIGLREAWQRQVTLLPRERLPEMIQFVREKVPLRKGAREFLELTRQHGVPVVVLSGGLDFYIQEVLDREGVHLPMLSDRLIVPPTGPLQVDHPYGHPTCRICGICKAGAVRVPTVGVRNVLIADGSTDKYAAEVADVVFARRRLLSYCERVGIPCYPFEDFEPVTAQFRRWLEEGEPIPTFRRLGDATSLCPISVESHARIFPDPLR
jgi:2-hydroxy-3-keto-5-methylthiopentenyl-1-phosphate phosphatase